MKVDSKSDKAKLWALLDDIDTLSDSIKPTSLQGYKYYYKRVCEISEERHQILETDGYSLFEKSTMPEINFITASPVDS